MARARFWVAILAGVTAAAGSLAGQETARTLSREVGTTRGAATERPTAAWLSGLGGFVGGDVRFGTMLGEFAPFVGAEAAVVLRHRAIVGVRGAGLATSRVRMSPVQAGEPDTLRMGYGGLVLGYIAPILPMLGITVDALLGAGTVGSDGVSSEDDNAVFVFEPSATLDLALARAGRLGVGVTYRYVGGASRPGVSDSELRGVGGLVRLRVGRF